MNAPRGTSVGDRSFDAFYFQNCCGRPYARNDEWLRFFGDIADRIVADIRPKRVLDAGCALGLLVETLRDRDVEAFGIDISSYAIANVYPPIKPFCRHGSVTEELVEDFDLIVAIEVVEHMPTREAEAAIRNFCSHTRDILFSSSPTDYREPTHVNVHPPEHWAEQFARHGFYRDVEYDASFVTPWAARFRRIDEPMHRIARNYEKRYWQLTAECQEVRRYSMETQAQLAETERQRNDLQVKVEQLAGLRADRDRVATERDAVVQRLSQTSETISNMERSWFWKMRKAYVQLRRLFQPRVK